MSQPSIPAETADPHPGRAPWQPWLTTLLLALLAVAPRCIGLDDFFTVDEATFWIRRVATFSSAIETGTWAATYLTEHPGVTTAWLGAAGRRLAIGLGVAGEQSTVQPSAAYLGLLRLPIALVNGVAVGAGYLALRRLVRPTTALVAAIVWACSPFVIAFSRLLHVDGLATSFATLSMLLLLLGGWRALLGSGLCLGLALLSKSSTLVLLPWAGLALLAQVLAARAPGRAAIREWPALAGALIGRYLLWLVSGALICYALWPALWANPLRTILASLNETISNGAEPHVTGNYFLGRPVADPGWGFYPLVIALRGTPLLLLGLVGLPLALSRPGGERRALLGLLGWALLFGTAMSFAAKKFDRYLLPAWPALIILAAAGIAEIVESRLRIGDWTRRRGAAVLVLVCLLEGSILWWYHPYYIAYYNPALGGGAVADRAILVGWGEGMEQVGAWLSARPDLERGAVLSWIAPTLAPFVPPGTQLHTISASSLARRGPAPNYAVLYVRGVRRREAGDLEDLIRRTPPLYTLRRFGITYATVHQLPRPYDVPVGAVFDGRLALRGFSIARTSSTLTITPAWDVRGDQPGGIFVFVHVIAPDGRMVAQVDAPIDEAMFATWQAGQQFGSPLPIALPADRAPGVYRITLGAYVPGANRRLPLDAGALPPQLDGPDALLLTTFVQQ